MISGKNVFSDAERLPAHFIGKYAHSTDLPETNAEIVFLGRSNSGKSSLLKALINCPKPPQVSSRPGSTRLIHAYRITNRKKSAATIIDFPGFGYAQSSAYFRERFSRMLLDYLKADRPTKAICLIMDCRRALAEEERLIAQLAAERQIPTLLCLNKADQLRQADIAKLKKSYQNERAFFEILLLSATKRQNLEYLRNFFLSLV